MADYRSALDALAGILEEDGDLVVAVPGIVDEWSMAVARLDRSVPHHFYALYWVALVAARTAETRLFRQLPPPGRGVDARDPFPSDLDPETFRFEEVSVDDLAEPCPMVVVVGTRPTGDQFEGRLSQPS